MTRPTRSRHLSNVAIGGGAVTIGIVGIVFVSPTLIPLVLFGAFICPAYNLEWFGGRLHQLLAGGLLGRLPGPHPAGG